MKRATSFALRRSKLVLGLWVAVVVACAGLGMATGNPFAPANTVPAGTGTAHWSELTSDADFGNNVSVLLTGPETQVHEQAMVLTARLRALAGVRVVSPYDRVRTTAKAQPKTPFTTRKRNSALLAVDVSLPEGADPADAVTATQGPIDATVRDPVTAHVTGGPAIAKGISDELRKATKQGEAIAAPILMIVLLLIFRSPVAAAIPLIMGMGTVLASKGIIELLATRMEVDQMALNLASMMALALGVDYSLLLVSRYREHRRGAPGIVRDDIERASANTRRTIGTAAILVLAVMAIALVVSIIPILKSVALGVAVATSFGALSALVVAPALLHVLDPWLERWRLPQRRAARSSRFAVRQPIAIPIAALVALLALAAPTLGMAPGAPDVRLLPKETQARVDYEQIGKVVGPGIGSMFDIAIRSRGDRPLTKRRTLAAVARLQREIAAEPGVASVVGPGVIAAMTKGLGGLQQTLAKQGDGLKRLDRGLARAAEGSDRIGENLGRLHAGAGAAGQAAGTLTDGLQAAARGSQQLVGGIAASRAGSERLTSGSRQARAGATRLSDAIDQASTVSGATLNNARVLENDLRAGAEGLSALRPPVATAAERLAAAWQGLNAMTAGRTDPQYQATLAAVAAATVAVTGADPASGQRPDPGYEGIDAGLDDIEGQIDLGLYLSDRMKDQGRQTQQGVSQLARGANRLNDGVAQLTAGSEKLSAGLGRLTGAGGQLPSGLGRLTDGAGMLTDGLGRIDAGSGQLAAGVGSAAAPGSLANGLARMHRALSRQRNQAQLGALMRNSPQLFRSGGFPLALVNGAARPGRQRAQFVLDLTNGGRSARILAIPAFTSNDARLGPLHDRIAKLARDAAGPDLDTAVGGPAAALQDFKGAILDRLPLTIAAFILVAFLVLMVALRAIPLAIVCVVLNLLTVGVAFGAMQLAFGSSDPLLGGPGYVDLIAMFGALSVVFALSIDYQIFLLARIREEYSKSGSNERAVTAAIGSTAGVITGAAAVMVAVFLASAASSHIGIREVGIGLAVAVFLDATVVRLVLLPAAMRLGGDRIWWFPAWLDRRVPNFSL